MPPRGSLGWSDTAPGKKYNYIVPTPQNQAIAPPLAPQGGRRPQGPPAGCGGPGVLGIGPQPGGLAFPPGLFAPPTQPLLKLPPGLGLTPLPPPSNRPGYTIPSELTGGSLPPMNPAASTPTYFPSSLQDSSKSTNLAVPGLLPTPMAVVSSTIPGVMFGPSRSPGAKFDPFGRNPRTLRLFLLATAAHPSACRLPGRTDSTVGTEHVAYLRV